MTKLKAKKLLIGGTLIGLMAFVGGCHYKSSDSYRGYGRSYGSYRDGSYRDGWRDGRTYERRRDDWRDSRSYDRRDYYRNRW